MRTMLAVALLAMMSTLAVAQTTPTLQPGVTPTPGPPPAVTTTPAPAPATTATVPAPRDAAIVMCGQEFSTGGGALVVFSASVSANGPAVAPGAACAQALADLFVAGFGVIDVQPVNQQVQYTLVR